MGQKIHPTGFRLSVSRNWSSRWYANNSDFAGMLQEDIKVREYLKAKLKNAAVSRILIERGADMIMPSFPEGLESSITICW